MTRFGSLQKLCFGLILMFLFLMLPSSTFAQYSPSDLHPKINNITRSCVGSVPRNTVELNRGVPLNSMVSKYYVMRGQIINPDPGGAGLALRSKRADYSSYIKDFNYLPTQDFVAHIERTPSYKFIPNKKMSSYMVTSNPISVIHLKSVVISNDGTQTSIDDNNGLASNTNYFYFIIEIRKPGATDAGFLLRPASYSTLVVDVITPNCSGGPLPTPTPTPAPLPTPTPVPLPTPTPANAAPIGWLDSASCGSINGWACDPTAPNQAIKVDLYDGPGFVGNFLGQITANGVREPAVGALCGGSSVHGFAVLTSAYPQLADGATHNIYAYGLDTTNPGNNAALNGNPKALTCSSDITGPAITINTAIAGCYTPSEWAALPAIQATAIDPSGVASVFFRVANATDDSFDKAANPDLASFDKNPWSQSRAIVKPPNFGTDFYLRARAIDTLGNASAYTPPVGPFDYQAVCGGTAWVQTQNGDVHSNGTINIPGGPTP